MEIGLNAQITQVRRHRSLKHVHQPRIHEAIVIGNIQNIQPLVFKQPGVLCPQTMLVLALHYKNDIGPTDIRWADRLACIGAGARRTSPETRTPTPDRLPGRTTPLVTTANEQEIGHS